LRNKSRAELDIWPVGDGKTSEMWRKKGRREEEVRASRKRRHEALFGEASLSEEKEANDRQQAAKPLPNEAGWQSFLGHQTV
jgi:hypothetical protein